MATHILTHLALLLVGAIVIQSADITNKRIEWISVSQSQAILMKPEPAGLETNLETYLCRALRNNEYFAGKLLFTGSILCAYGSSGTEYYSGTFQMLNIPAGSTSWVTLNDNDLYSNAVIASIIRTNEIAYVCRAKHDNKVFPGFLMRMSDAFRSGVCYIGYNGKEIAIKNRADIEVMVINQFGRQRGVTQALRG